MKAGQYLIWGKVKMQTIIGIDLGTSTTEVAVIKDGKPVLLNNYDGNVITPSVVGVDESGNYIVGDRAKSQLLLRPNSTIAEIKRKMGTDEKIRLDREVLSPIEISSKIIAYAKRYASVALEEEIKEAVISVPAYFNEIQRRATVEAAEKAGLNVRRIINEPTAAALSYGLEHLEEESLVLVYDLGGGTFDVTLLEMFDGVLEVKASSGDNTLGGKDFDECLMHYLIEQFEKRNKIHIGQDTYALAKLKEAAENCKIALSERDSYTVHIPMLITKKGIPYSLEETVNIHQFEEMIQPYIERTHLPIQTVLSDSKIAKEEIDFVLLVGGSTRIPMISKDIEQFLGIQPVHLVNPDYAVAEGAAIQGGIISGVIGQEDSIIMTDVNPFSLGVSALTGLMDLRMSVIIPRNTTIPVTREEIYWTSYDNQEAADIRVYQGESIYPEENQFLGKFRIGDIPMGRVGKESIKVSFSYNLNGMLSVEAMILSTKKRASIEIDLTGVTEKASIDVSEWTDHKLARSFRSIIRQAEKQINQRKDIETVQLQKSVYELKKAIIQEEEEKATEIQDMLLNELEILEEERNQ